MLNKVGGVAYADDMVVVVEKGMSEGKIGGEKKNGSKEDQNQ